MGFLVPAGYNRGDDLYRDEVADRSTWTVTTHNWATDVDREHLADIRNHRDTHGAGGRRHLVLEVLAYANDEAEHLGRIGRATVFMRPDGAVSVVDDGRGTDTRTDSEGRIVRKPVMATRDVRFFDAPDGPVLPDGLPRCGMSAVAALSADLVHENHRSQGGWSQTYHHGIPDDALHRISVSGTTGTSVTFQTDLTGPDALTAEDVRAFPWLQIDVIDTRSTHNAALTVWPSAIGTAG